MWYNLFGDNVAIDGFFIKNLINETNDVLLNNRLEQIKMISNDTFSFVFYYMRERNYLNIKLNSPNASFFLGEIKSNSELTSNFLQTLKRNLEGYILTSIKQVNLDRVIFFEFEGNDFLLGRVSKRLVLELMGRYNNLILVDSDNTIIDAYFKNVSHTSRTIVPKHTYELYPNHKRNLDEIDYSLVDSESYLTKNYIGISPIFSKYLFENKLNPFDILVSPVRDLSTNKFYWFNLFESKNLKTYQTLSNLLLDLFDTKDVSNSRYQDFVIKLLAFNIKKKSNLEENLKSNIDNLVYENYGNYIFSSGLNLGLKYSEITSYDGTVLNLDSSKTLKENALEYFKRYQKSKRSITFLEEQINDLTNLISLLEQIEFDITNNFDSYSIEQQLIPLGFKTKKKTQKPKNTKKILEIKYSDNVYYVGKNNLENEYITHTLGKPNDLWFHIKDRPGSHILMKGEVNDFSLKLGLMIAAYFSKEKNNPVVTINYTEIKHIRKIPKLPGYKVILKQYKSENIRIDHTLINQVLLANDLK